MDVLVSGPAILVSDLLTSQIASARVYRTTCVMKEELVKSFGYNLEKHEVQTDDGYILSLYRIPGKGVPILMLPGFLTTSDIFVLFNNSLAYQLNQMERDVWLINFRGTTYSRKHATMKITDIAFWEFSMDEIGLFDLPATITYILNHTKQEQLKVVGFSMGTSIFFIMASEKPEMMSKVHSFTAIAPIYSANKYRYLLHKEGFLYSYSIKTLNELRKTNKLEGFARSDTPLTDLQFNCTHITEDAMFYCSMVIDVFINMFGQWVPAGTSLNLLEHFIEVVSNGMLTRYNHGKEINLKLYKQETPPPIKLDKIKTITYIVYSEGDEVADQIDIENDSKRILKLASLYKIENEDFQHADFISSTSQTNHNDYNRMIDFIKDVTGK